MRDLVLLMLLPILIYFAVRKPFIGLSLWLWTSLVPMQTWAYGPALSIRWNLIFAVCTIIGYVFMREKPKVRFNKIFFMMFIFLVIATFSSFFHQGFDISVWLNYERFFKAMIFFLFTYLIVDKKLHVEALMWACLLSITAGAAKQGVKIFFSGGNHVVYGISSTFPDNNLSALATLMCIPLSIYLLAEYKKYFVFKWGLIGALIVAIIFVLGSDSRGGVLGLGILGLFYFYKSKNKIPILTVGTLAIVAGLSLMDDSWFERMNSIQNASEDESFMGRVIAWKFSILMAIKSPLWGGGFDSIAYQPTWQSLMPYWNTVSFISTPMPTKGHVAHSVYFQVLGDLGFFGFFIYCGILYGTFKNFSNQKYQSLKGGDFEWLSKMSLYCMLSLICFLTAGAALSSAYNEILFMLIAVGAKFRIIYEAAIIKPQQETQIPRQSFVVKP